MTPAERLVAAADLLDKRASEATAGPWTATVKDGGRAWVNTGEHERAFSLHGWQADTRYIATMHPEVGKALAEWLRFASRSLTGKTAAYQELLAKRRTVIDGPLGHALNVADRVLAGGGK